MAGVLVPERDQGFHFKRSAMSAVLAAVAHGWVGTALGLAVLRITHQRHVGAGLDQRGGYAPFAVGLAVPRPTRSHRNTSGCGCIPTRRISSTARTTDGGSMTGLPHYVLGVHFSHPNRSEQKWTTFASFSQDDQQRRLQQDRAGRSADAAGPARSGHNLADLARQINPVVRGWLHHYAAFYRSALYPLLSRNNSYLMRWIGKKYRRLRAPPRGPRPADSAVTSQHPRLFAHGAWARGSWWSG